MSMTGITIDEMTCAINSASPKDKIATAERMLRLYKGDDKELIEQWLLEMAIVESE